jgi:hypothetical protein
MLQSMDESYRYFDSLDFDEILCDLTSSSGSDDSVDEGNDPSYYTVDDYFSSESRKTSSGSDYVVCKNRVEPPRKRKYKPHAMRYDIRRSYAAMFTNVINAMDFRLLYGFLDTYFAHNFIQENHKHDINTNKKMNVAVTGIVASAKFWYNITQTTPDAVISLHDTEIHLSSDPRESRVISNFSFRATQIYDLYTTNQDRTEIKYRWSTKPVKSINSGDSDSSYSDEDVSVGDKRMLSYEDKTGTDISELDRIVASLENVTEHLPLLETPVLLGAMGRMIMHTNENHFITKIVFETPFAESSTSGCPSDAHCKYPQ